jgi:3-phosphoshikimate 1-carboxyvinyltransferase
MVRTRPESDRRIKGSTVALPELIELEPITGPIHAHVTVPGSKSVTNRALILAALGAGTTVLHGALWSEDTRVMVDCLRALGCETAVEQDPVEEGNRTLRITGQGGRLSPGGSPEAPLHLFVGNAGTAARFVAALVCLGSGVYRLDGVPRMRERPQAELFAALRQLGYRVDSPNHKLPALIHGRGASHGFCEVSAQESSQFASALLLSARAGGWTINVCGGNSEELPYVEMTRRLVEVFPPDGGEFRIEPDASSGSYFWGAGWLLSRRWHEASSVGVAHWPASGWQVDESFPSRLSRPVLSRKYDLGDSIMTAIVLAPFGMQVRRFTDLERLRVQECERVHALRTELERCGAQVTEEGETLTVRPSALHGAEIETYHDHRMAMCFAMCGLQVPGIRLRDPACVAKTFPNFFARLAAAPPAGLGARVLHGRTRQPLDPADLLP